MANQRFVITHSDNTPLGGTGNRNLWFATVDADKPSSGMRVGDLLVAEDSRRFYVAISSTQWAGISQQLFAATASVQVTNTTTPTSVVGSGVGSLTLPADFFTAGKVLRVFASGAVSVPLISDAELRLQILKGSTALWTATYTLPAATVDAPWLLDVSLIGRSGTSLSRAGLVTTRIASAIAANALVAPITGFGNSPVTISASSEALDIQAKWTVADFDSMFWCDNVLITTV